MKNLDLNSYGVQEIDATEMKEIDGGFLLTAAIIGLCVVYIAAETLSYYKNGDNNMQPK